MKLTDGAERLALYDQERIDFFLAALQEFRTRLSAIETQHPFLRHDFSSACDDAISRLSSAESLPENISPPSCEEPPGGFKFDDAALCDYVAHEIARELPLAQTRNNPVVNTLDRAGGYLVLGLDKMGDGIIMAFESILKLGNPGGGRGTGKSGSQAWGK
jgi:hypothetical protein